MFTLIKWFRGATEPAPVRRPIRSTGLPIFDAVLDEAGIEEPDRALNLAQLLSAHSHMSGLAAPVKVTS